MQVSKKYFAFNHFMNKMQPKLRQAVLPADKQWLQNIYLQNRIRNTKVSTYYTRNKCLPG